MYEGKTKKICRTHDNPPSSEHKRDTVTKTCAPDNGRTHDCMLSEHKLEKVNENGQTNAEPNRNEQNVHI